ncbi:MAG: glycoside hydrolase family 127 protein [Lachnospiraceae bacterium]|jgi:DUF1680 family protein|nr:glycoside hydrolase family 127 protein [Lachnospiraceae bacterium]
MDETSYSKPLSLHDIVVEDPFWKREQDLVRTSVIPYQWEALNDRIEEAAPSYCMRNFKVAARMNQERGQLGSAYKAPSYTFRGFQALPPENEEPDPNRFYGFVFQDSDFSKWIEAVAYSLTQYPDAQLQKTADEAIDLVCSAQQENGYLDTYYIINGMDGIFTNLKDHHELYCFGHFVEGAVAYYQATGNDKLLQAAKRFADFIMERFGVEEGKSKGYPGHEIAEMALVRLAEVTKEEKYLTLSRFFLDMRGTEPSFFEEEEKIRTKAEGRPFTKSHDRYTYYQADQPVREMSEAKGHAVRAVYLYSGMADIARITQDEEMAQACRRLWHSIVDEKMYVTGGIGATHIGESFSFPYDLPGDTAYSETCAAIGLVFFARRMLQMEPKAEYADVMERALYNGVLPGMALDGKSFFYVNPLEVVPEACRLDARKSHVKSTRQKWFGCACCPPNIARMVSSVSAYAYTENEDTFWFHLMMGSKLTKKVGNQSFDIFVETQAPWGGDSKVTIHADTEVKATLAFRRPGWCKEMTLCVKDEDKVVLSVTNAQTTLSDQSPVSYVEKDGYLYVTTMWHSGMTILIQTPMDTILTVANPKVRETFGQAALVRGPMVYCLEEMDNPGPLHLYSLVPSEVRTHTSQELGHTMVVLEAQGKRKCVDQVIKEATESPLYRTYEPVPEDDVTLRFVPYYAWNNRGEGEMRVFLPLAESVR